MCESVRVPRSVDRHQINIVHFRCAGGWEEGRKIENSDVSWTCCDVAV